MARVVLESPQKGENHNYITGDQKKEAKGKLHEKKTQKIQKRIVIHPP